MRPGRAVRADRRRGDPRRGDRLAPRPLAQQRPRRDRAVRRRPRSRALRVQPRLPRECSQPRLRLRAVGAPHHRGHRADRLRPRRAGGRLPRSARAPVLVLLPLQRLEQPARGRLGDDPARLPGRQRRGGARGRAARGRVQPARGRRARGVGGGKARDRRRHAPGRLPGGRLARELLLRGALPRPLRGAGRRLRRHDRPEQGAAPGSGLDPERARGRASRLSLDRLRGPLGRAPAGVLQRPDRAEPEGAVDGADDVGGGLARRQLRGARRRLLRDGCDRLLLRGGRGRIELRPPRRRQRSAPRLRPRPPRGAGRLPADADHLAAVDAAACRPPPFLGADLHRIVASLHQAAVALPRHRAGGDPDLARDHRAPVPALLGDLARRHRPERRGRRLPRGPRGLDRDGADAPRPRPRAGGLRPRDRRDRRR